MLPSLVDVIRRWVCGSQPGDDILAEFRFLLSSLIFVLSTSRSKIVSELRDPSIYLNKQGAGPM